MPQSTDRGHRIILVKILDLDSSKFVYSDQVKIFIMSMDLWILQEGTAEGHEIVIDLSGMTLSHLAKMSPLTMKKLFYYLQVCNQTFIIHFYVVYKNYILLKRKTKLSAYSDNIFSWFLGSNSVQTKRSSFLQYRLIHGSPYVVNTTISKEGII